MPKKIIFVSILAILLSAFLIIPVKAQNVQDAQTGLDQTAGGVNAFSTQTGTSHTYDSSYIAGWAGQIIGVVLSFIGIIFLGLMIYGGIIWMTAQGNEQQVTKAKDLITSSIIGIVIVFAAYAITVFIGQKFIQQ
jgi:hypothetical protein